MTPSAAAAVTADRAIRTSDERARFESEAIPYMRQMFPAALRLTRNHCDAEDLIQETFARAYHKFHLFSPGTNLKAWRHRIMFHTFYSSCRKRRRRPPEALAGNLYDALDAHAGLIASVRSAEAEALANLGDSPVMRALRDLPQCFRTAVYLADVHGYQYQEIADMMATPLGTVMSRIHRGRRLMRARLQGRAERQRGNRPAAAAPVSRSAQVSGTARAGAKGRLQRAGNDQLTGAENGQPMAA